METSRSTNAAQENPTARPGKSGLRAPFASQGGLKMKGGLGVRRSENQASATPRKALGDVKNITTDLANTSLHDHAKPFKEALKESKTPMKETKETVKAETALPSVSEKEEEYEEVEQRAGADPNLWTKPEVLEQLGKPGERASDLNFGELLYNSLLCEPYAVLDDGRSFTSAEVDDFLTRMANGDIPDDEL